MDLIILLSLCIRYSLTVFAAGFVLGFLRVVILIGKFHTNEAIAIVLEIPIMLTISWFVAIKLLRDAKRKTIIVCHENVCKRQLLQISFHDTLQMGLISFVFLQAFEYMLAMCFNNDNLSMMRFITLQLRYPANIGMWGQIGFALIPAIQQVNFFDLLIPSLT